MAKDKVCAGCGAVLQSLDPSMPGYVPSNLHMEKEGALCQRCFKMRHYNETMVIEVNEEEYLKTIDIQTKNNIILYVVDIFNFHGSIIPDLNKYKDTSKIIILVNKLDLLPKSIKRGRLMNYIKDNLEENKVAYDDIVLVSANNNYHLDELMNKLVKDPKYKNIYLVGNANVGKSSIINSLLHNYSNKTKEFVTTSLYPGTTLKLIKIPFTGGTYLYDTPGLYSYSNICHHVSVKNLKYLLPRKEIKPISFQLNGGQSLFIGSIARIDFVNSETKFSAIAYANHQVNIHRSKLDDKTDEKFNRFILDEKIIPKSFEVKSMLDLVKTSFKVDEANKKTICISGLVMVDVVSSNLEINVYAPNGVGVSIHDSFMGGGSEHAK